MGRNRKAKLKISVQEKAKVHLISCTCHVCALVDAAISTVYKENPEVEDSVIIYDPRGNIQRIEQYLVPVGRALMCYAQCPLFKPLDQANVENQLTSVFGRKISQILRQSHGMWRGDVFQIYGGYRYGTLAMIEVSCVLKDVAVMLKSSTGTKITIFEVINGDEGSHSPKKLFDTHVRSVHRDGTIARLHNLETILTGMLDVSKRGELSIDALEQDCMWVDPVGSIVCILIHRGHHCLLMSSLYFRIFVRRDGVDSTFNPLIDGGIMEEAMSTIYSIFDHICSLPGWHVICLQSGSALGLFCTKNMC
jgi:hypothetical protein